MGRGISSGKEKGMFLTGEGALLAVALGSLVLGMVGTWALLRMALRKPRAGAAPRSVVGKVGNVRRVTIPAEGASKVS
jgi:hypothetical protein